MASHFHAKLSRRTIDGGLSSWRTTHTPNRRNTWKKYVAECSTTETQWAPRYPSPIADFLSRYKVRVAPRGQGALRVGHGKRRNDRRRRWKISLCVLRRWTMPFRSIRPTLRAFSATCRSADCAWKGANRSTRTNTFEYLGAYGLEVERSGMR